MASKSPRRNRCVPVGRCFPTVISAKRPAGDRRGPDQRDWASRSNTASSVREVGRLASASGGDAALEAATRAAQVAWGAEAVLQSEDNRPARARWPPVRRRGVPGEREVAINTNSRQQRPLLSPRDRSCLCGRRGNVTLEGPPGSDRRCISDLAAAPCVARALLYRAQHASERETKPDEGGALFAGKPRAATTYFVCGS
jgi:hypothetical protein